MIQEYQFNSPPEDLYQHVKKLPIQILLPTHKCPKDKNHVILQEKEKNILHFCSEDYKLHDNANIFKPFEEMLKSKKLDFVMRSLCIEKKKFFVDYILTKPIKSNVLTMQLPMISIWNSYDGTVAKQIRFGFYRVVSGNRIARPTVHCDINSSTSHRTSEDENETMKSYFKRTEHYLENIPKDIKILERLKKLKAGPEVLERIADKLKYSQLIRTKARERLTQETNGLSGTFMDKPIDYAGSPVSPLTIYTSLNYAIYNNNPKELPSFKRKKDVDLICEILRLYN